MARYDQDPNFAGAFPTGQDFNAHDSAYPGAGSTGITPVQHSGAVLGQATLTASGYESAEGEQKTVSVGSGDSNSMSDGIAAHTSEIDGHAGDQGQYMDSGAGKGQVENLHHPNNMWGDH